MKEQELNREQELEVVKTAYFLEDQIATQTKELNQLDQYNLFSLKNRI